MGPVRGTGSSSILTLRTQDPSYLRRGRLAQELLRFAAKAFHAVYAAALPRWSLVQGCRAGV